LWKWWETAMPSGEIGRSNGSEITPFDQLPPLPIINDPTAPLTSPPAIFQNQLPLLFFSDSV
ncbi:MAG: hypothetical protein ACE1Y1_05455, partial [Nitrosomonadaceae bacterium]